MGNKRNLQKELEKIIERAAASVEIPKLLLHACCAPYSSYCMEYLSEYFAITIYFYNPNIDNKEEYIKRVEEEKRLIAEMNFKNPVSFLEGEYEPENFHKLVRGHERDSEGGERCFMCYEMRLRKCADEAKNGGYDYFATTLTISPVKDAGKLCEIGEEVGREIGISYLPSDFKKKNGYKRSVELSQQYGLYRQDYCGCSFSKRSRSNESKANP